MVDVNKWSSTAAANDQAAGPPDWAKEAMDKSDVNDTHRETQAAVRRWYEDPSWVEPFLVEAESWTFSQISTSSFRLAGPRDASAPFVADRRVRLNGSVNLFVTSVVYGAPNTDVTVDETTVPATITQVELASIALADSVFSPLGTAGATLVHAEDLGTPIGQTLPLGTAATVDHGTAGGEVPLNTDLGSASLKDTSTAIGDVPINVEAAVLDALAYRAVPLHYFEQRTSDQSITSGADRNDAQLTGITIPGADGTRKYRVNFMGTCGETIGHAMLFVGSTGDVGDTEIVRARVTHEEDGGATSGTCVIAGYVFTPGNAEKIGVGWRADITDDVQGIAPDGITYIELTEVLV